MNPFWIFCYNFHTRPKISILLHFWILIHILTWAKQKKKFWLGTLCLPDYGPSNLKSADFFIHSTLEITLVVLPMNDPSFSLTERHSQIDSQQNTQKLNQSKENVNKTNQFRLMTSFGCMTLKIINMKVLTAQLFLFT